VAARAIQGVGGALLIPNSLAIIGASFEEARRGKAIGTWAGFTAITMVLGPVLGGYQVENVSWRAVFFINVPLALAVLAITFSRVPESRDEGARGLDLPGLTTSTGSLWGFIFSLLRDTSLD
jgi:MFS family permease